MQILALLLTLTLALLNAHRLQAAEVHVDVFGHVDFTANQTPRHRGFLLGAADILLTGSPAPGIRAMVETDIEPEEEGDFEIELERLFVSYDVRDFLTVTAGKIHTPLGTYNTMYHHGRYLETAVSRPLPIRYERDSGILPMHSTGLFLSGRIRRPENWEWTYDIGLSNGLGPTLERLQMIHDDNGWKALATRFGVRPVFAPALQAGAGGFFDRAPAGDPETGLGETTHLQMVGGYAVYDDSPWEGFIEFYALSRTFESDQSRVWSRAGFAQLGYEWNDLTPYLRGEVIDAEKDRYLSQTADLPWVRAARLGLRYDPAENIAVKMEGAREDLRGTKDNHSITVQFAFTF